MIALNDTVYLGKATSVQPTIPTVNNATITLTQGGTTKGSFTLNQSSDATIELDAGSSSTITTTWYTGNTGNSITISDTSSATSVLVFKNGVMLQPTQDYSISGTTLSLVTALIADDKITVQAEFGAHDAPSGTTVTSSWHSGTEWYRIWSDGWCEQGGHYTGSIGTDATLNMNLHQSFVDTNYSLHFQVYGSGTNDEGTDYAVNSKTTSSFVIANEGYQASAFGFDWEAKGYIR